MVEFIKSDPASIQEFADAVYEIIPARKVRAKSNEGWLPVSPFIAMTPPADSELRAIARAADALGQE
jgi:hypothetical protein